MARIPTSRAPAELVEFAVERFDEAEAEKQHRKESTDPYASYDVLKATGPAVNLTTELAIDGHERFVYRMSAVGGDTAMLVAGALGIEQAPMPATLQPYLDEGTAAEPRILELFHDHYDTRPATYPELAELKNRDVIAGYDIRSQQAEVWLPCGSEALLVGHTDEIVCVNPRGKEGTQQFAIVEAKAFGGSNWQTWQKRHDIMDWPRYAWQVSAMMHATGLACYFVVGEKDRAEIKAGDKGAIVKVDVKIITEPPFSMGQLKARVLKAEAARKKGVVPECDEAHWPCAYYMEDFCKGKAPKDEQEFEDLDDVELGRLLGLFYAYTLDMAETDEQKEAKTARDAVKLQIDKMVSDKGYARGAKLHVWDEARNEYEFEWVQQVVKPSDGGTRSFPRVKVVGGAV